MSSVGYHKEDDRAVLIEVGRMERNFGYVNTYGMHKRSSFLGVKRYSIPILPGNDGFKSRLLGSEGRIPLGLFPNAYTQVLTEKPFYATVKL